VVGNEETEDIAVRAADRLMTFSDGVAAIAITLLAIDLPVPTGNTVAELWSTIQQNEWHYAAFLISFLVIAASWSDHHDIFRYNRRIDPRLRSLNMAWLLTIILNPFATKLLTSRGTETLNAQALRFGFYALLQVLSALVLFAIVQHMASWQESPDTPLREVNSRVWQAYGMMLGFGLSIPLFFVTNYAWLLWFLIPIGVSRTHRLRRRREARSEAEP
jgi:uncharacterized membrane protein